MAAGRILIVDGIATNRVVMRVKLETACHRTLMAGDGATCLRMAHEMGVDLILMDQSLPDRDGLTLLAQLQADPDTRAIPVVMLTSGIDAAVRQAALAAGAVDVLAKPVDDQVLLARIRNLLRLREDLPDPSLMLMGMAEAASPFLAPGRVGMIFPRLEQAMALRRAMAGHSGDSFHLMQREEALGEGGPCLDAFVVDAGQPPGGGLRLLSELRSRSETRHAGICFWITGPMDAALAAQAYDMGADDVLWSDMPPREIALRLSALIARRREGSRLRTLLHHSARLAVVDDLTGLWNRRFALPHLEEMAETTRAAQEGLAVMVLDIDHFKAVNDCYGHAAGNAVLVAVTDRLRHALSGMTDALLARVGGEEFLVALPCPAAAQARHWAEELRHAVGATALDLPGLPPIGVTISVGLALLAGDEPAIRAFDRADHALLWAKDCGRDRVRLACNAA